MNKLINQLLSQCTAIFLTCMTPDVLPATSVLDLLRAITQQSEWLLYKKQAKSLNHLFLQMGSSCCGVGE